MYDFRALKADYVLETSMENGYGYVESSLKVTYGVEARYMNIDDEFRFTISRKGVEVRSEGEISEKIVDGIMSRLGDSVYPVELVVSKDARISGVKNFEEIKERWESTGRAILEEAYSVPTERYIGLSKPNMADEASFTEAFCGQLIVQLLFRDTDDESFWLFVRNFDHPGSSDLVKCERTGDYGTEIFFETVEDWDAQCRFGYVFSELGDVLSLRGQVAKLPVREDAPSVKRITLTVKEGSREIKKASKLKSFLFD